MRVRGRWVVAAVAAVGIAAAAMVPSGAASVNLPVEFTSGGVRWGDLTTDDGFTNDWGSVCTADVYVQADAVLVSTGQNDAFDGIGGIVINGEGYLVPPGDASAPVDLTGSKLTSASAPVGGLNVSTEWYGLPGQSTIRYLVTLQNPGATDVTTTVEMDNELGSDNGTTIQGSSSGQSTTYPTNERWFATSQGNTDPSSDPPINQVVTGPGAVRSPGTVVECPEVDDGALARGQAKAEAEATAAAQAEAATTTTTVADGDSGDETTTTTAAPDVVPQDEVSAQGTDLDTDQFVYVYNVTVPAGETRAILVYWSLFETIGESVAAGAAYDVTPSPGSALVEGLTQEQLCRVVNWDFGSCLSFTG